MPNVANEVVFTGIVLFNAKLGFFFLDLCLQF